MNHPLAICFVISLMGFLIAMTKIPEMPRCPLCGKTREHATNCPTKK